MSADVELLAQETAGTARPPLPSTPRPIVIVGAGGIVHDAHLPAYRKAGFPVAAIVDPAADKAAALAQQFSVPQSFASLPDALSEIPNESIFDVAVPAGIILKVLPQIPDGSAVLIQKPMGDTFEEASEILRLCRKKKLIAAINFQLRYAPAMAAARKVIEAGLAGEIYDLEVRVNVFMPWDLWSFLAKAPRLEILYHSIHYVDLVRSFLGNPTRVLAKTVRSPRTPKLSATRSLITMDYGDWKRVSISTNHSHLFQGSQESYVQWEGTDAALRAVMGVNLDYPQGKPDSLTFAKTGGSWQTLPVAGNWFPDAFIGSMGSLQAYVTGEAATLPISVEDAIDTMRVVEAAYLSSDNDGTPLPEVNLA